MNLGEASFLLVVLLSVVRSVAHILSFPLSMCNLVESSSNGKLLPVSLPMGGTSHPFYPNHFLTYVYKFAFANFPGLHTRPSVVLGMSLSCLSFPLLICQIRQFFCFCFCFWFFVFVLHEEVSGDRSTMGRSNPLEERLYFQGRLCPTPNPAVQGPLIILALVKRSAASACLYCW